MKTRTSLTYHQRIGRVLDYIVNHVDGDLSVDALARVAHFSPYHFHRVFKAIAGETVGEVIQRIRLELAAKVLRQTKTDIAVVALNCGYESPEAFGRVFRKNFGVPPGAYRKSQSYPSFSESSTRVRFDPVAMKIELIPVIEDLDMQITIVNKPETRFAYIPHVGPYTEVRETFNKLMAWSASQGINPASAEIFSQSYDSPRTTPADQLRSEACISLDKAVEGTEEVKIATRGEQRYAVYTHQGHYNGIADAYEGMLAGWLNDSNEELADKPFVEIYKNDCTSLPPEEWLTDLCIPLK